MFIQCSFCLLYTSGSDKKGKLGMAEVSLFLNNSDGKAAIDYSELVLTRRLYRDGESEYLSLIHI